MTLFEKIRFDNALTTGKEDWLTPPEIVKALGEFDLDPCAAINQPWPTAKRHFTLEDNGLNKDWMGRIWLNPPYGAQTPIWMERLAQHGNGIALIFARTETAAFFPWVWKYADALLFIRNRIHFYTSEGKRARFNCGAPVVLVAYGQTNVEALEKSGLDGKLIKL